MKLLIYYTQDAQKCLCLSTTIQELNYSENIVYVVVLNYFHYKSEILYVIV
jgi:hypothetical protein